MAHEATIRKDGFISVIIPSYEQDAGTKARKLVEFLNSETHIEHNMGGSGRGSRGDRVGLAMNLANSKAMVMSGSKAIISDEKTPEQEIRDELTNSFASEVADIEPFIEAVTANLGADSTLTPEQKENLRDMVLDIINLKNLMNLSSLPENQARLQAMIAETANKIAEALLDSMDNKLLSPAIVDFVHGMLAGVQSHHDIPALNDAMVKIEGRMNPENYLAMSAADIIAQLSTLIENQDLSDEARAEIEDIIEKIEQSIENGEPVPRDVMMALEALTDNHPDIAFSNDFSTSLETLKDANIVLKADALGISVAQMHAVENSISTLGNQLQAMIDNGDAKADIADIKSTIEKLQAFADEGAPLDQAALEILETSSQNHPELTANIVTIKSIDTQIESDLSRQQTVVDFIKPANINSGIAGLNSFVAGAMGLGGLATAARASVGGTGHNHTPAPQHRKTDSVSTKPQSNPRTASQPKPEPGRAPANKPTSPSVKPKISIVEGGKPPIPPKPEGGKPESDKPSVKPNVENDTAIPDKINGHHSVCNCGDAFKKAAKQFDNLKTANLADLKQSMRDNIVNNNKDVDKSTIEKIINDDLIKHIDDLSPAHKTDLIKNIAQQDFNGDVEKAQIHVEAVDRLQKFEQSQQAQRQTEKDARDNGRQQRFDNANTEQGKTPKEIFKPKGCPQHGDTGCPEGSHGTKAKPSENKTPARQRKLKR